MLMPRGFLILHFDNELRLGARPQSRHDLLLLRLRNEDPWLLFLRGFPLLLGSIIRGEGYSFLLVVEGEGGEYVNSGASLTSGLVGLLAVEVRAVLKNEGLLMVWFCFVDG
uniref:Uncharacterized protein n=1 Tax=Strombidium inclinatum TaxID=197538 RepID=A0A7S3IX49_9SPIT